MLIVLLVPAQIIVVGVVMDGVVGKALTVTAITLLAALVQVVDVLRICKEYEPAEFTEMEEVVAPVLQR